MSEAKRRREQGDNRMVFAIASMRESDLNRVATDIEFQITFCSLPSNFIANSKQIQSMGREKSERRKKQKLLNVKCVETTMRFGREDYAQRRNEKKSLVCAFV